MLELSDILQKNLISKETSQIIGSIKNVYFSKSCDQIAYFIIEDCINNIHLISPSNICAFSDCVMTPSFALAKNVEDVDFTLYATGLMNMPVYTQSGVLKGYISSVQFSKNGKIAKLATSAYSFSPQSVANAQDVIILKSQNRSAKPRKIIIEMPKTNTPVELFEVATPQQAEQNTSPDISKQTVNVYSAPPATRLDDGMLFSNNALKLIGAPQVEDTSAIPRIISDYDFLIGRVLTSNLTTYSGKIIAVKGDVVNDMTIQKARHAGRLAQLVLISQ